MGIAHLELLAYWNAHGNADVPSLAADLTGKLDMGSVGLVGHSRGGMAVRQMQKTLETKDGTFVGCASRDRRCHGPELNRMAGGGAKVPRSTCGVAAGPSHATAPKTARQVATRSHSATVSRR